MTADAVACRVLAEFEEMPGLTLTDQQAARLFGLDPEMCQVVIDRLTRGSQLRRTTGGHIARVERR
jgi:hypothetical protein